jgi:hypothetical protein
MPALVVETGCWVRERVVLQAGRRAGISVIKAGAMRSYLKSQTPCTVARLHVRQARRRALMLGLVDTSMRAGNNASARGSPRRLHPSKAPGTRP